MPAARRRTAPSAWSRSTARWSGGAVVAGFEEGVPLEGRLILHRFVDDPIQGIEVDQVKPRPSRRRGQIVPDRTDLTDFVRIRAGEEDLHQKAQGSSYEARGRRVGCGSTRSNVDVPGPVGNRDPLSG